jgi:hypothetical protein
MAKHTVQEPTFLILTALASGGHNGCGIISDGRGHRWGRVAFTILFGVNTYGLVDGLARGSAVYAWPDLAIGTVLWLVQLATAVTLLHVSSLLPARSCLRQLARRRSHSA